VTEGNAVREPKRQEEKVSVETMSLLFNWFEMGVLLAILFRLGHTFELIANTQRELRRAIYHLGERRAAELGIKNPFGGPESPSAFRYPHPRVDTESMMVRDEFGPPIAMKRSA
jgi:hypothetical protein